MGTPFTAVYNRFLDKITDDLYMELTPQDTLRDVQSLLVGIIPNFEFPRVNLYDYTKSEISITKNGVTDNSTFNIDLTEEEINILSILMMDAWLQRQITSIENTRMKYSGSDFKFTSQANHLAKLLTLQTEIHRQSHHMQRLYKRRKTADDGRYASNWSVLKEVSALDD